MSTETITPGDPAAEQVYGIILFLHNPLAGMTPLSGESGKQYLFQRMNGHGERHVLLCGSVAEYRAVRLDLLGADDRLQRLLGYQLGVDFMTEAEVQEKRERDRAEAAALEARQKGARAEYLHGLAEFTVANARTLVRLKGENDALRERVHATGHGGIRASLAQKLADDEVTVQHLAKTVDTMLTDYTENFPAEDAEGLRGQVLSIFDGAAVGAGVPLVDAPAGGGSVDPLEAGVASEGVAGLPADLVILDHMPEEPLAGVEPSVTAEVQGEVPAEVAAPGAAQEVQPPAAPKRKRGK